jgi:hypothetical protein
MADNKHIIEVSVFDAGLNTKAQAINLPPGQSPDLKNVVFDDFGSVSIRPGIKTHNSSIMSSFASGSWAVMGLTSYKPSTMSALLLAFSNGTTWVLTGNATSPASVPSSTGVWPLNQYVESVVFQELCFMVSKDYQPYKFNGVEFTKMGVSAPTWQAAFTSDAVGNLDGAYKYVFWGVNSYGAEGDYGVETAEVTLTSGQARITGINTAPISAGINTWKVGRNSAGATGVYWYLTDVTNGTTSFTDNLADSSLVELAPIDQGYPRQFQFITAYGGRVWGAYQDYLWFSNSNQPEEFPSENFIRVGRGDGMDISAITPFMGMIVISKADNAGQTSLYTLVIGDSVTFADPESWYLKFISNGSGAESHRAVVAFSNYLMLPNRYGVHLFDGNAIALAASESSNGVIASENIANAVSDRFKMSLPASTTVPMKAESAIKWDGRILLSHPRDTDQAYRNSQTLAYDYQRVGGKGARNGSWTEFPSRAASQFAIHEGKLFGGGPDSGYIYQWDNGEQYQNFLDLGSLMAAYYVTAPFHGADGHESYSKDFRWVIFSERGGQPGGDSNNPVVTATFYVDGSSLSTATLIHTETYSIGTSGRDYKILLPAVARGKRLWIKYSWVGPNSSYYPPEAACKLSRIKICYNMRGLRNA